MLNQKKMFTKILGAIGANVSRTNVASSYGINAIYNKSCGVRILHIEGNPSGYIGTGGHSFTITDPIVDSDPYFRSITQTISASNYYSISLQNNVVTIQPVSQTSAYVNATFVY